MLDELRYFSNASSYYNVLMHMLSVKTPPIQHHNLTYSSPTLVHVLLLSLLQVNDYFNIFQCIVYYRGLSAHSEAPRIHSLVYLSLFCRQSRAAQCIVTSAIVRQVPGW